MNGVAGGDVACQRERSGLGVFVDGNDHGGRFSLLKFLEKVSDQWLDGKRSSVIGVTIDVDADFLLEGRR